VRNLAPIPAVSPDAARRLSQRTPSAAGAVRGRRRGSVGVVRVGRMAASVVHRI
jgi:hypothetical protein